MGVGMRVREHARKARHVLWGRKKGGPYTEDKVYVMYICILV